MTLHGGLYLVVDTDKPLFGVCFRVRSFIVRTTVSTYMGGTVWDLV